MTSLEKRSIAGLSSIFALRMLGLFMILPVFSLAAGQYSGATPLLMALVIIEITDILFALDSIPAILAITANPFIVFSSNILAILGLRSMYFLVSRMLTKFRFINYSLVVILAFVGTKMLLSHHVKVPEWISLSVIVASLVGGILASVYIPEKNKGEELDNSLDS